jgi:hypothetical protein
MPTCACIKVQRDGLKEKAAKSRQRWDPVSKRLVVYIPTFGDNRDCKCCDVIDGGDGVGTVLSYSFDGGNAITNF